MSMHMKEEKNKSWIKS